LEGGQKQSVGGNNPVSWPELDSYLRKYTHSSITSMKLEFLQQPQFRRLKWLYFLPKINRTLDRKIFDRSISEACPLLEGFRNSFPYSIIPSNDKLPRLPAIFPNLTDIELHVSRDYKPRELRQLFQIMGPRLEVLLCRTGAEVLEDGRAWYDGKAMNGLSDEIFHVLAENCPNLEFVRYQQISLPATTKRYI
jgi:hypothetical protein